MAESRITSCICTVEGDEAILDTLYSLTCQTVAEGLHEILMIALGPGKFEAQRDAVARMVEQGHAVGLVFEEKEDPSAGWQRAAATSRAPHLHFFDADTIANARLIECLLQSIDTRAGDLLLGNVLPRFRELPPPELDYDYWTLWGLRHYGNEARDLQPGEEACANNFCVSRSLLEKELLRPDGAGNLLGWKHSETPRAVPGAFAFKKVSPARYAIADQLDRIIACDAPPPTILSRFGLAGAVCDELLRATRRGWFQLGLALAGRRP